ncbi:hypothetical protein ZTR_04477 [Talaromyces verruculosus]|nr:hypothetical protein ZTR_04477 [Talaromyces verruculosus]
MLRLFATRQTEPPDRFTLELLLHAYIQQHTQGGLGWTAEAARVVQSQGTDLYSFDKNLLLRAAEYTAKYNLGYDVPYDQNFYRCEAILVNGPWSGPSTIGRGYEESPAVWDILYYQYVVKRGLNAPWTTRMKKAIHSLNGEGHSKSKVPVILIMLAKRSKEKRFLSLSLSL